MYLEVSVYAWELMQRKFPNRMQGIENNDEDLLEKLLHNNLSHNQFKKNQNQKFNLQNMSEWSNQNMKNYYTISDEKQQKNILKHSTIELEKNQQTKKELEEIAISQSEIEWTEMQKRFHNEKLQEHVKTDWTMRNKAEFFKKILSKNNDKIGEHRFLFHKVSIRMYDIHENIKPLTDTEISEIVKANDEQKANARIFFNYWRMKSETWQKFDWFESEIMKAKQIKKDEKAAKKSAEEGKKLGEFIAEHKKAFLIIGILAALILIIASVVSSCSVTPALKIISV